MSSLLASAEPGPWAFGWDFFVALGTLGLAWFTARLAARTRDLAQETAADQRAQWRPVLLPIAATPSQYYGARPDDPGIFYNLQEKSLHVRIRNNGRGPALYVRAHLERAGEEGALSPRNWSRGTLAPGEAVELTFEHASFAQRAQLLLDYRDLAGRPHASVCTIERGTFDPRVYDVLVFEDHSVTKLGDALYPQEGLRDVRPPTSPSRMGIPFKKTTA